MARRSRNIKATVRQTIFYVATEGSVTERKYFDALIKKYNLRNVRLLKKAPTRSSPIDVIKRLERQVGTRKKDHDVTLDERFWAVFDTDRRPVDTLAKVSSRAARKSINLAASNPCFELWLLLHFGSLANLRGLEGSAATGGCKSVTDYLKRRFDKDYDKTNFDPTKYINQINSAINNATASGSRSDDWMLTVGSHVYKLVQSIIASSPNNPLN